MHYLSFERLYVKKYIIVWALERGGEEDAGIKLAVHSTVSHTADSEHGSIAVQLK
jgi:hypothetical protein